MEQTINEIIRIAKITIVNRVLYQTDDIMLSNIVQLLVQSRIHI